MGDLPLNHKDLSYMRKIEIVIESRGSPYFPGFDTAMADIGGGILRCLIAMLKGKLNRFEQVFLVAFNTEVVVRALVFDQKAGQFSLS